MRLLSEIRERFRVLLRRDREDRELDEELRFHLEMAVEENLRRGMNAEEARRRAALRLGGLTQVREATRDARGLRWLERWVQDTGYALRGIRANPVFAAAFVLTLGLGLGASGAMFSVVDALLLRPLPYQEPGRLVEVHAVDAESGNTHWYVPLEVAALWAERDDVLEAAFAHVRATVLYTGGTEPVTLAVGVVSPGFERTLGVSLLLGRGFSRMDAHPSAEPVALLGYAFWRTAFGADPDAIGRSVDLDGIPHRVVGIMPATFKFPTYSSTEAWVVLPEGGTVLGLTEPLLRAEFVARLRAGATIEVAQDRADALAASFAESMPRDGGWSVQLTPFGANRTGETTRRAIWFLVAGVGLILLVAVLNGVNLLLVRGWSRTRELAVRVALGASRQRLIGQLLTESSILALAAGVIAVLLAFVALRLVQGMIPSEITFSAPYDIVVERRTLLFVFAAAAAAGLAAGVLPAVLASRVGTGSAAGGLTAYAARTPVRSWLRRAVVTVEVALSVALLIGAGLLLNSFARLMHVDPGFRLENIAIMDLSLSRAAYPTGEARMQFLRRLEERLEAIPGVARATTGGGGLPVSGITFSSELETDAGLVGAETETKLVSSTSVSPDFFDVFEIEVFAGRRLHDQDAGTDHVVVSGELARLLWGDDNALGKRFRPAAGWDWLTVVGVTGDLRLLGPHDRFGPEGLQSNFTVLLPASDHGAAPYASIAVRTAGDPSPLFPAVRAALHELDALQPISKLETAEALYAETVQMPRFLLLLMSVFSGLALLLAAVGIYGVLAYGVAQHRFDLGVRIALGARPAALSGRVLGEGVGLAVVGTAVGIAGALALSGLIHGLLFGVAPGDPLTIAAVVTVTLTAAAAASWWPARRTLSIDPAEVLKVN